MTVDVSLIPQERIKDLISTLDTIQSNIGNIGTYITNNVVHKSGDETITGTKTFSNWPIIKRNYTSTDRDNRLKEQWENIKLANEEALPSNSVFSGAHYYDGNNFEYGTHYSAIDTSGNVSTMLWVHHPNGNASQLGIYQNASGDTWTTAPTPNTSDNSTKIATTAYVKNQNYIPQSSLVEAKVVITTYQSGFAWYRIWSDGWCEQGDCVYTDVNGWQNATCTLLIPMKDTNYHVSITSSWSGNGDGASYYYANNNKTTTSFVTNVVNYSPSYGYSTWKASGYKA